VTEERIAVLETQMCQVLTNQDEYKKEAYEWRSNFCRKLDKVLDKLDSKPCVEHGQKLKQIGAISTAVWGLILVLVPIILSAFFVVSTMLSDIRHIKDTSYEYRGIKVVQDGKL
jgi:tetrahydromethanopterin S-methyltransferase subunit G